MAICGKCGAEVDPGGRFCQECGAGVPGETYASPAQEPIFREERPPVRTAPPEERGAYPPAGFAMPADERPGKGSAWAPVTTLGWIGVFLLLLIPIVNLVLLFIWAFGGCRKKQKASFARAALILTVISIAATVALGSYVVKNREKILGDLSDRVLGQEVVGQIVQNMLPEGVNLDDVLPEGMSIQDLMSGKLDLSELNLEGLQLPEGVVPPASN